MSLPDHWSQLDSILRAALERPEEERHRFVEEACGGDETLRAKVERLLSLAAEEDDLATFGAMKGSIADSVRREVDPDPAAEIHMAGDRIGQYEILELLGRGGMGQVYRARDHRLGREVALKVVSGDLARDTSFLKRFEREGKLLAAVNHPNIAAIYELLLVGQEPHLILELVQGETIDERLRRGPLPIDQAIAVGTAIAEALEEAHRRGIVHRDLKPANVKLTPEGRVKVLDFGLAKSQPPLGDHRETPARADVSFQTRSGVLLGTAPYMSPEQVRGEPVEKSSDIWAFGCVLFEMLTGERAFPGGSVSETLASVLRDEVDLGRLPSATPPGIRRLLKRCLRKNPRERLQDMGDARLELVEAAESEEPIGSGKVSSSRGKRAKLLLAGAVLGAGFTVAGIRAWNPTPSVPQRGVVRSVIPLAPYPSFLGRGSLAVALSGDGARLVYAGSSRSSGRTELYLRSLDRAQAVALPDTEGARSPFFSPDGRWVGFVREGELHKISIEGGTAIAIGRVDAFRGGSWGPDDSIIYGGRSGLFRVSASGGEAEAVTRLDPAKGVEHWDPIFLPQGDAILYTEWLGSPERARILFRSLTSGEERPLLEGATPRIAQAGHLVFARGSSLWVAPFDLTSGQLTGRASAVIEDVHVSFGGSAQFDLAVNGTLAYLPASTEAKRRLLSVDRQGEIQSLLPPGRAREDESDFAWPRFSPDGRSLAVYAEGEVWIFDLERGTRSRLTFGGDDIVPVWLPGGSQVTFSSSRHGPYSLYRKALDPSAVAELLLDSEYRQYAGSWSPDGRTLAYHELNPRSGRDLWVLKEDGAASPYLVTPFEERAPAFSRDGKWLAYVSNESGRDEVYVQPYPGTGRKWTVSREGGTEPVWAKDRDELFYRLEDQLWSVSLDFEHGVAIAPPRRLFTGAYEVDPGRAAALPNYDVSPDARRFVMIQSSVNTTPAQLQLVLNWFQELERVARSR